MKLEKKLLGENHVLVGDSYRVLAHLYYNMKNYEKAERHYTSAIETFRNLFPGGYARMDQLAH